MQDSTCPSGVPKAERQTELPRLVLAGVGRLMRSGHQAEQSEEHGTLPNLPRIRPRRSKRTPDNTDNVNRGWARQQDPTGSWWEEQHVKGVSMLLLQYHPSSLKSTGRGGSVPGEACSKVSLSTSLHGWVKEERTYEHHSSYPQGFTQGCRRQPGSTMAHHARGFYSFLIILPISPGRRRPLQSMGPGSSFSREAQDHLLYCNVQVCTGAKHIQGEGTSPSVLPTLKMWLPKGFTPRCQTVKALN